MTFLKPDTTAHPWIMSVKHSVTGQQRVLAQSHHHLLFSWGESSFQEDFLLTESSNSDLIDGLNVKKGLDPLVALRTALESFDPQVPVFHVVGKDCVH